MPLRDVLKSNGYTDEQITSIAEALGSNADAVKVFEQGLDSASEQLHQAQTKLDEANSKQQQVQQWWEQDATKQINDAYSRVAQAEARSAFYQKQVESAKESGFLPADAPAPAPQDPPPGRAPDGRFVANANPVPGSPAYMTQEQGWKALASATWAMNEYQRLYGQPMPENVEDLVEQATRARREFRDYVSEKYKYPQRREEIQMAAQKAHDDKITSEALERYKKEQAERNGSNPDLRPGVPSNFSKFQQSPQGQTDKLSWARPDAKERMREYAHAAVAKETNRVQ